MKRRHILFVLLALATFILIAASSGCRKSDGPVAPPDTINPTARFSHSAPGGYVAGQEILFDATASSGGLFRIDAYIWDWGDGSEQLRTGVPTAAHIFELPGTYEVRLTVMNQAERSATASSSVDVIPIGHPPTACFSYEAPEGWQPDSTFVFDASCSSDPDGDELTYIWTWAGGDASDPLAEPTVSHAFDFEGEIEVSLTVRDPAGWETVSEPMRLNLGYPIQSPPLVGSYDPGELVTDVIVRGDVLFVGGGFGLKVLDISDPSNMEEIGSLSGLDVWQMDSSGDLLVSWAYNSCGLWLADISDSMNPRLLNAWEEQHSVTCSALYGEYCYVGGRDVTTILDVSDPLAPVGVGLIDCSSSGLIVDNGRCYLKRSTEVRIYDVGSPRNPVHIGTYTPPPTFGDIYDFAINDSYLYVTPYSKKLAAVDVSDPSNPREVSLTDTKNCGFVRAAGNIMVMGSIGLDLYDISSPASPQWLSSAIAFPWLNGFAISGDYLYLANAIYGLNVVDIGSAESPPVMASFKNRDGIVLGDAEVKFIDIEIVGDYAFYTVQDNSIDVVDIRDPGNPGLCAEIETGGDVRRLALRGDYVFAADYKKGLYAIDVGDPCNPEIAGFAPMYGSNDVVINDHYAYVPGITGGDMKIIDISDPADMQNIATVGGLNHGACVETCGHYAFQCGEGDTLNRWTMDVIDIADPSNPALLTSFEIAGTYSRDRGDMALADQFLYVLLLNTDGEGWINAYDISNPSAPALVTATFTQGFSTDFEVIGDYAYTAAGVADLTIFDLSNPAQPRFATYAGAPQAGRAIAVRDNLAFLLSVHYASKPPTFTQANFSVIQLW